MDLLSAVGSAAGLGPVLARTSVGGSWLATRSTASWSSRAARGAVATAVAAPAGMVRAAAALVDAGPARRTWTSAGRAHVEVWGLDGPSAPTLVGAVQDALYAHGGVSWARVDAVTRRAVVRFEPERVEEADLVALVAGAEQALDRTPGYRPDEPPFPGDSQPVHSQAWALAADVAGLSAAVAGRLTALPSLPGSAAAAGVLVDNQPRLRRLLEARLGPAPTDLALAVSTAAVQGLTPGASSLLVDTAQRAQALLAGGLLLATDPWALARLRSWLPRRQPPAARPVPGTAGSGGAGSMMSLREVDGTVWVVDEDDVVDGGRAGIRVRCQGTGWSPLYRLAQTLTERDREVAIHAVLRHGRNDTGPGADPTARERQATGVLGPVTADVPRSARLRPAARAGSVPAPSRGSRPTPAAAGRTVAPPERPQADRPAGAGQRCKELR